METIRSLVQQFGGQTSLARKLAGVVGEPVSQDAIYMWCKRQRISSRWHRPLLALARAEKVPLTAESLIELATPRRDARGKGQGVAA